MKKAELRAIADRYGMEILRNPITNEAWGLMLDTVEDIPELDALASDIWSEDCVAVTKEYGMFASQGSHLYKVACPVEWFGLWGWRD